MASSTTDFTATHILYITPRGSASLKPTEAFDITSYATSKPGSKDFKSEVDRVLKDTIKGANPPQPILTSTKESRFAATATISTPSNPNLATFHTPFANIFAATIKYSDEGFHPEISVHQDLHNLSRAMAFVFNSREYKWKWDFWFPSKLVIESNGKSDIAALFYCKGAVHLGGVMAVDEHKVDLSVAFATILICLRRERQRRHWSRG